MSKTSIYNYFLNKCLNIFVFQNSSFYAFIIMPNYKFLIKLFNFFLILQLYSSSLTFAYATFSMFKIRNVFTDTHGPNRKIETSRIFSV